MTTLWSRWVTILPRESSFVGGVIVTTAHGALILAGCPAMVTSSSCPAGLVGKVVTDRSRRGARATRAGGQAGRRHSVPGLFSTAASVWPRSHSYRAGSGRYAAEGATTTCPGAQAVRPPAKAKVRVISQLESLGYTVELQPPLSIRSFGGQSILGPGASDIASGGQLVASVGAS